MYHIHKELAPNIYAPVETVASDDPTVAHTRAMALKQATNGRYLVEDLGPMPPTIPDPECNPSSLPKAPSRKKA
jgi:hypothetical protein